MSNLSFSAPTVGRRLEKIRLTEYEFSDQGREDDGVMFVVLGAGRGSQNCMAVKCTSRYAILEEGAIGTIVYCWYGRSAGAEGLVLLVDCLPLATVTNFHPQPSLLFNICLLPIVVVVVVVCIYLLVTWTKLFVLFFVHRCINPLAGWTRTLIDRPENIMDCLQNNRSMERQGTLRTEE